MTKEDLIEKVRDMARRLGKTTLTRAEFRRETGFSDFAIRSHFDSWSQVCAAAGIEPERPFRVTDEEIFVAMREAFEAQGDVDHSYQLQRHFRYAIDILRTRWSGWLGALEAFRDWALQNAPDFRLMDRLNRRITHGRKYGRLVTRTKSAAKRESSPESGRPAGDALAPTTPAAASDACPAVSPNMSPDGSPDARPAGAATAPLSATVSATLPATAAATAAAAPAGSSLDASSDPDAAAVIDPIVGDVLAYRGIMFAPVNEMGVVMLFAAAAHELGFVIESSGVAFPDCIVWRRIAPGRWKRLRVEIEYRGTNFRVHRHDATRCQLIVCWEHDWLKCPVEVFDLKAELAKLRGG